MWWLLVVSGCIVPTPSGCAPFGAEDGAADASTCEPLRTADDIDGSGCYPEDKAALLQDYFEGYCAAHLDQLELDGVGCEEIGEAACDAVDGGGSA
ncbi:MAG: hypothetical protein ABMB14_33045 [Myxococcota bacterium]